MRALHNPGRVAGLWYLLLVMIAPLRMMYIPSKLYAPDDPAATMKNIAAHAWLFRFGVVGDLACAVILIFLVMAFYRLFETVDRYLAVLVIFFGGVMPALLNFVNAASDGGVLLIAQGAAFLSAFSKAQQDALAVLLLRVHGQQYTAAEILWGVWLFPLAVLVYRSGFLPRFLGVWLGINGLAYVAISLTGLLLPEHQHMAFVYAQPALFGEMALMLWLVIRGARPPETDGALKTV